MDVSQSCEKNKINCLHQRFVSIIYNGKISTFKQVLEKDSSVSIHTRNLWFLAVEIFKVVKGFVPKRFSDLFSSNEQKNFSFLKNPFLKKSRSTTVRNGFESISYLGSKIWEIMPQEIQACESFLEFKVRIKSWNPLK